jgi:PAS domain S-box-containing protein
VRRFPVTRGDGHASLDRRMIKSKKELVERLSTKETLDEPWEQLISIFDAIDEKVYIADPESYDILYANPAMKKIFGEKALGGKCYTVMQDLDSPCDFCTNPLIFGENLGNTHIWEFRNRKTGSWVRNIDRAIKWWDGRMVRFGMAIDIHNRKVAEEGLKQSEEKYRQLVENIHEVIYATDIKGTVTYVSPAVEPLTGYTPSEIEGRHFSKFIFDDDVEYLISRYDNALSGQERPAEYRILTKSGGYRWVRTFTTPARQGNDVVGLQGVLSDMTEYREAQAALQESEKRFRVLLETMNEGFRVVDENGVITYANETLGGMLGFKVDEMIGYHATEFLDEEGRKVWHKLFEKRKKDDSTPYEMTLIRKDGERVPAIVSPRPIFDEKGVFRGSFAAITDISNLKRSEKSLKESEKELKVKTANLEEMNAALRVLLRRMEEDRRELEDKVRLNIQEMIQPYLERLKVASLSERHRGHLKSMEANLNEIMSPFTQKLLTEHPKLTPAELQIANLLRQGRSSKEIADDLGLSLRTVETHRRNMRTKLGIKDKKTNLRSYLLTNQYT